MTILNNLVTKFQINSLSFLHLSKNPNQIKNNITFKLKNNSISYINKEKNKKIEIFLDTQEMKISEKIKTVLTDADKHKLKENFTEILKQTKAVGLIMNPAHITSFTITHNLKIASNNTLENLNELNISFEEESSKFTCIVSPVDMKFVEQLLNELLESTPVIKETSEFTIQSFHQDCLDLLNFEQPIKKKLIIKTKYPVSSLTIEAQKAVYEESSNNGYSNKITCNFDEQTFYYNNQKQSNDYIYIFHKKIQSIYKANSENRAEFLEEI